LLKLLQSLLLIFGICTLYFASFVTHANLLGSPLFFKHFSKEQGLPQSSVIDILRSRDGYFWIATQAGLSRFDGNDFKVFKHDPKDPHSISDDFIWSLAEDRQGMLWIATRAGGLNRYDPKTERFTHFQHNPNKPRSISSNEVTSIAIDTNQRLWAGTANEGLNLYDAERGSFQRVQHQPGIITSINSNTIKSITPDAKGNLWIGFSYAPFLRYPGKGVCYFDTKTMQCTRYQNNPADALSLSNDNVADILIDNTNQVWIATFGGGLNLWRPQAKNFKRFSFAKDTYQGAVADRVSHIHQDKNGHLWMPLMGTGLLEFSPKTYEYFVHQPDKAFKYSLSERSVSSVYEYDGQIIVGTWRDGFFTSALSSRHFKSFMSHSTVEESQIFKNIASISEDDAGHIWVANRQLLFVMNEKGHIIHQYKPSDLTYLKPEAKNINFVFCDSRGRVWVGSNQAGLFSFKPDSDFTPTELTFHSDVKAKLISSMVEDTNGDFWIGTKGQGLFHYKNGFNQIHRFYSKATDERKLDADIIAQNGLTIDDNHTLWIATIGKGLHKLNLHNNKKYVFNKSNGLSHDNVTSVLITQKGIVWVGTQGGGVNEITPNYVNGQLSTFDVRQFRISDGLASNNIGRVLQSSEGAIWMSTNEGISRILPKSDRVMNLYVEDGALPSYSLGVGTILQNSKLLFGGFNGLTQFNGSFFASFNANHQPLIHQLQINNQPIKIGEEYADFQLPQALSFQRQLEFSSQVHQFGFGFTGLEFSAPQRIKYAYQLSGFDKDWITTDATRRFASYTNIPPGNYVFKLKASNKYGEWLPSQKQITVKILGSPWRSNWALASYALVILLLIILYRQLYYNQRRAVDEKNKQIALIETLFANTSEAVLLLDKTRRIVMVNSSYLRITGRVESEVIGSKFQLPCIMEQPSNQSDIILDSVDKKQKWQGQLWDLNQNEVPYAIEIKVDRVNFANPNEQDICYISTFYDVTDRLKSEQQLHQLAYFDDLTQLPNRSQLQQTIDAKLESEVRHPTFGLMFIDLDDFKIINDSLGHDFGDQVLQAVASRMKRFAQQHNTIFARLGGDEFLVYVPVFNQDSDPANSSAESFLRFQAQRMINLISQPIVLNNYQYRLTSSIGAAIYPNDGATFEALMRNSDIAMYQAKSKGRNRVAFYTSDMNVQAQHRFDIAEELKRAIEKQQFKVHFQPKIKTDTEQPVGVEVLARWHNEKLGHVSPIEFITTAEEIGLIGELSEQIMTQACVVVKELIDKNQFTGRMSVNLSPVQFRQRNLVHTIDTILKDTGFPPDRLELEITETMVMNDFEQAIATLKELRKRDIEIAVDDFGTGYSSMSYLCQFPLNTLKIDRSFICQMTDFQDYHKVVDAMIKLAHTMGLQVVAEGVESQQEAEQLKQLNCDYIQGYYYSKPLPQDQFEAFLRASHTKF
jgi:diguanylate cyclase (GGDEF)-like protein